MTLATRERSTRINNSPKIKYSIINRIQRVSKDFCYSGNLNGKRCVFRIDTGSDVLVVNKRFVREKDERFPVTGRNLKYPAGEDVPIEFEILTEIELGENSFKFPMLVSRISEDCLLGTDFLKKTNLKGVFDTFFGFSPVVGRIAQSDEGPGEIPPLLRELFSRDSTNLVDT